MIHTNKEVYFWKRKKKMEWNCCLPLFILSLVSKSHAFVEIIQQSKNWFEANNECVNKGGRLAHADELHPSTCANKSINVWIGKYNQERLTPWIANMGCFVTTKPKLSKPSVLECYLWCKSTPFGYQKPWCSCEDETPVNFEPDSPCITKNSNGNNGNHSWLYNKTEVDLSNEDYRMDCITAMCTGNNTTFRAVNCSENKIVYCQSKDYIIRYNESNTQAKSEITCKSRTNHLVSKGIYDLCEKERNTPEFWTEIKRFRYNDTGRLTDIVTCVYVRCQDRSDQETFEYCRRPLDGFACNINGTSDNVTAVKPSPKSAFASAIISSSYSSSLHLGYLSTNVPLQYIAENTAFRKGRVSMYAQSNTEHLILPTSVTSGLLSDHTSKHLVSASIKTSLISAKTNTIDMTTTVYSSFVTNKNRIELMENNIMRSTTTLNSSNSKIHQSSTGLTVGVPVSILVVLIIGLFIICRLRHLGPFKEKAEEYTISITKTTDPNYHDIDFDLEKETNFIDNDSKHNFLETKGDDIQFKPTDNPPNGETNMPNNAYGVVVKNRIPDAIKTEKNQDKDEHTFSGTDESDYNILNQPRRISGNESSNIYDTSAGNLDVHDPTYNTTTQVYVKERATESNYDHL